VDKKTIILVAILVLVVIFYFPIIEKLGLYTPPPTPAADSISIDTTSVASTEPTDTVVKPAQQPVASTPKEEVEPVEIAVEATVDSSRVPDTIHIVTNTFDIRLTTLGGGPVSLFLNDYTYRDGRPVQMLKEPAQSTPDFSFAGETFKTSSLYFESSLQPGEYHVNSGGDLELAFTYRSESGGEIIKRYRFYPDRYDYELTFELNNTDALGLERKYNIIWNTPLGVTEPQPETDYNAMEAVAMIAGQRETLKDFDDDDKLNQTMTGSVSWAGVRNKYFAAVIIPRNRVGDAAIANGLQRKIPFEDKSIEQKLLTCGMEMQFAGNQNVSDSFSVFVGPLDYTLMAGYDVGLEDILGIGTTPFVGWIIKPFALGIIWLLPRMYDIIPNYGLVIILFAFLVKIVTLPLSLKSFKSMNAMKEIQPKLDELKKKHKNNPQALNQEMMKLYKKHGVNPMSGCLPMLPQMPLFFALFSVFRSTILLRNAPFVWFINDLSVGASSFTDPYMILVLIMIGAQFISQKFTMAQSTQNKAFGYIMPLFMGFIFYKFAAGLVLYWTCFSVFSLIDYLVFRRNKNTAVQTA